MAGHKFFDHFCGEFSQGQGIALLGENGSGKSTFFRSLLDGTSMSQCFFNDNLIKRNELFNYIYFHQQTLQNSFPLTAKSLLQLSQISWDKIEKQVNNFQCEGYLNQPITTLSGGQWQRLRLALAFASEQPILFLDEPDSGLDIKHQKMLMEIITDSKKIIFFSSHNITLSVFYSDIKLVLGQNTISTFDKHSDSTELKECLEKTFNTEFKLQQGLIFPVL